MGATAGEAFPDGFIAGVALFNAGDFFEAHEAFEELLDAVESDTRWDLLIALIQVAVGYHKGASGNPGMERMLGSGLEKLAVFEPTAWGVDVGALRERVTADLVALARGESLSLRDGDDPPRLRLVAGTT